MSASPVLTLVLAALAYLAGSIPFGLLLTRWAGLGDVRAIGSGNIGATNVLRTGHKGLAAATLLLDGLKGAVAVLIAAALDPSGTAPIAAAVAAFYGHLYPVWLGFRGGKGVATFLGVMAALWWPLGLIFAGVWLAVAVLFGFSSLAALTAALAVPLAAWLASRADVAAVALLMAAMIYYTHRENIRRLIKGEESRISFSSKG